MNELFRPDQISFCRDDIYLVWTILTRQFVHDWRHNQPLSSKEYTFAVLLEIKQTEMCSINRYCVPVHDNASYVFYVIS